MGGPFSYDEPASYPHAPGAKARDTSFAAARSMDRTAKTLRERALEALKAKPSTADEIAEALNVSFMAIRPRLTEAAQLGLVEDTGLRRPNASGRKAIVWRVVP